MRAERTIVSMGRALYVESVEDAASIAGGYDRLAVELGVSAGEVRSWCAGAVIPDCSVLLRLVDLITAASDPTGRSRTATPVEECRGSVEANRLPAQA